MKKRILSLILTLCMLMSVFSAFSITVSATNYQVNENDILLNYYDVFNNSTYNNYALHDIDKNGFPELILSKSDSLAECHIYSFSNNRIIDLGKHYIHYGLYGIDENGVVSCTGGTGVVVYTRLYMENNILKEDKITYLSASVQPSFDFEEYTHKGNKISSDRFIELENKLQQIEFKKIFKLKKIKVFVNNEEIKFDQPPVLDPAGRVLVPIRYIAEAMGKDVFWSEETRTAFIDNYDNGIIIPLNESQLYIANEEPYYKWSAKYLDVPAQSVNGRTLVPVRAFCESLNATVDWNNEERTVYITYNGKKHEPMSETLFNNINLSYYVMKYTENPFEQYNYSINTYYDNRNDIIDGIAIGVSDIWRGVKELFVGIQDGSTNATNTIQQALYSVLSKVPQNESAILDIKLQKEIKGIVDEIKGGLEDKKEFKKLLKNNSTLEYLSDAFDAIGVVFDCTAFTAEELIYIFNNYSANIEYLNVLENSMKEAGADNDVLEKAFDQLRREYTSKFANVCYDVQKECLEKGVGIGMELLTGSTFGIGETIWKSVFAITGVSSKADALNTFYGIYCYNYALDSAFENKINSMKKSYNNEDMQELKALIEIEKATKIAAYESMKNITNWYNKDSKKYADDIIVELNNYSYIIWDRNQE